MIASGSGAPVMMATLAVGVIIVAVAFIVRRIVLNTDDALPRQPRKLWALALRRPTSPASDLTDDTTPSPQPERPDATRERGSAA